jgi:hypothetical protein
LSDDIVGAAAAIEMQVMKPSEETCTEPEQEPALGTVCALRLAGSIGTEKAIEMVVVASAELPSAGVVPVTVGTGSASQAPALHAKPAPQSVRTSV